MSLLKTSGLFYKKAYSYILIKAYSYIFIVIFYYNSMIDDLIMN